MTNKILLLILEFFVCVALGFLVPKAFLKEGETSAKHAETASVKEANTPVVEEVLAVLEVTDPVYDAQTKKYSFTATASSNASKFYLADSSRQPISGMPQKDGKFEVPAAPDGQYYVYVEDAAGHQSEFVSVTGCKPEGKSIAEKDKIKKEEFQRLLMDKNPNAATKAMQGRIASSVHYQFTNLDEDDKEMEPRHYTAIITNLQVNHWQSVTVISVGYNNAGQLNQARISVEY